MSKELTSIGFISRAHGTSGDVVLDPLFESEDIYTSDHVFYLRKNGQETPARIEKSRLVRKGDKLSFFVKFEHITDRTAAEQLKGSSVLLSSEFIPEEIEESDEDLIGYQVEDENGDVIGEVIDVLENPAHPLLQVKEPSGAFFIPLVEAYILGIDDEERIVVVSDISELKSLNG